MRPSGLPMGLALCALVALALLHRTSGAPAQDSPAAPPPPPTLPATPPPWPTSPPAHVISRVIDLAPSVPVYRKVGYVILEPDGSYREYLVDPPDGSAFIRGLPTSDRWVTTIPPAIRLEGQMTAEQNNRSSHR